MVGADAAMVSDAMSTHDGSAGLQLMAMHCDMVQEDLLFMPESSQQAQVSPTEIQLTDFRQTDVGRIGTLGFTIRSSSTPAVGTHYAAGATPGFSINASIMTSNSLLGSNDLNVAGELIIESFAIDAAASRDSSSWLRSATIRLQGVRFTVYPSNGERWCTLPDAVIHYQGAP
jgi:hypothetical protein